MKVDDAIETVVELEIVRARVRGDLAEQASVRVPLLVFGALTLGSALAAAPGHGEWLGVYWLIAAPAGMVVVSRHFRGLQRRVGIGRDGIAPLVVAVAMSVAAFTAGWFAGAAAAGVAIGAGYLAMAATVRSRTMAALGAAVLVATAGVGLAGVDRPEVALPVVLGTALLSTGLATRP